MTKMNWEHRNRMEKAKRAGSKTEQPIAHEGFVLLRSKWKTSCARCQTAVRAKENVWWWPEGKCSLCLDCFKELAAE